MGVHPLIPSEVRYVDFGLALGLNGSKNISAIPRRLGRDHTLLPVLLRTRCIRPPEAGSTLDDFADGTEIHKTTVLDPARALTSAFDRCTCLLNGPFNVFTLPTLVPLM